MPVPSLRLPSAPALPAWPAAGSSAAVPRLVGGARPLAPLVVEGFTNSWPIIGPLFEAMTKPPWLFVLGAFLLAIIYDGGTSYSGRSGQTGIRLMYASLFPILYGLNVNAIDLLLSHFGVLQKHSG